LGALGYPHENALDASVNYAGTGDNRLDCQYYMDFFPGFERGGSESSIPRVQGSPVTSKSCHGGQHSTTEQYYNLYPYDEERAGFLDSGVAGRSYGWQPFEIYSDFGISQATSIPRVRNSPVTSESYHGGQYSTTEKQYNFYPYDEERAGFLDSGVAGRSYGWQPFAIYSDFGVAQATSVVSNEVVVVEHTNPLLSSPAASTVGNKGATQVAAESPPVDVGNLGIQRSGKRKRSASPDSGHEGQRTQRKKRRHSAARGQAQVSLAGIILTQKGAVTTVVLDFPDHCTLAHAPQFPRGGTDCVPIAKCAERLATPALE